MRNEAYIDSIKSKAEDLGGESDKELRGAVDGFTAALTPLDVNELRADPNVRYIEPDALIELDSATFRTVKKTTTNNLSSCDDCSSPSLSLGFMTVSGPSAVTGTSTSAPPPGPTSSPCSPT
ncbi:MAG: hypothetical protein EBY56_08660 [Actinobacteria bacterium]|nr:hypothetical protein [Actinomycetota bacterium]